MTTGSLLILEGFSCLSLEERILCLENHDGGFSKDPFSQMFGNWFDWSFELRHTQVPFVNKQVFG